VSRSNVSIQEADEWFLAFLAVTLWQRKGAANGQ
jgi:hypothetical protein